MRLLQPKDVAVALRLGSRWSEYAPMLQNDSADITQVLSEGHCSLSLFLLLRRVFSCQGSGLGGSEAHLPGEET